MLYEAFITIEELVLKKKNKKHLVLWHLEHAFSEEVGEPKKKFHCYSYSAIGAKITLADVQKIEEFMTIEIEGKIG